MECRTSSRRPGRIPRAPVRRRRSRRASRRTSWNASIAGQLLLERHVDDFMHPRLVEHLLAHGGVEGEDHARARWPRARRAAAAWAAAATRSCGRRRVGQRLFGREEAIDVGARHAEALSDVGDGGVDAELAEQVPGDAEDLVAGFLGGRGGRRCSCER